MEIKGVSMKIFKVIELTIRCVLIILFLLFVSSVIILAIGFTESTNIIFQTVLSISFVGFFFLLGIYGIVLNERLDEIKSKKIDWKFDICNNPAYPVTHGKITPVWFENDCGRQITFLIE